MKFTTNKINWTDAMKEFATDTVTKKLDRLVENPADATIKISKINNDSLKVTLSLGMFRAQSVNNDFYLAMTDVAAKLKTIITRHKKKYTKAKEVNYNKVSEVLDEDLGEDNVVDLVSKEKIFNLVPIKLEDAIEEFEQTDYPFYIYKDIDDKDTITVIYKRFGGTYGLIRCH